MMNQTDKRIYVDDAVLPASRSVVAQPEPEKASNLKMDLPALIHEEPEMIISPWRKDISFAAQLLCVMLLVNIALYFVFNYDRTASSERLALTNQVEPFPADDLALEERVLTYSKPANTNRSIATIPDDNLGNLAPAAGGRVTVTYPSISQ